MKLSKEITKKHAKKGLSILLFLISCLSSLVVAAAGTLQDPTAPQFQEIKEDDTKNPKRTILHVSAIFISGNERYAVVNDVIVEKGDQIGNKVIKDIEPYFVVVTENGKSTKLYLLGEKQVKKD